MVPFFAGHRFARMTLLTKAADVANLLGLDHRGHTILSWSACRWIASRSGAYAASRPPGG